MQSTSTTDSRPRIVVADDHTIIRNGLHLALSLELGMEPIAEASSCSGVMSVLREHRPSHLILDMVFRDGNSLEILPAIVALLPALRIMVYSMMPKDVYFPAVRTYGVQHFLSKEAGQEETSAALRAFVLRAPAADGGFDTEAPLSKAEAAASNPFTRLSPRELEVLHYLLRGEGVGQISALMNLHKNTVSTLKARVMQKLDVDNMKALFEMANLYRIVF